MRATDDDLEGTIVYTLEGDFPVQSFVDLDANTGVVTLRNSLLSDSTQNTIYTVRCHLRVLNHYNSLRSYPFSQSHNYSQTDFTVIKFE